MTLHLDLTNALAGAADDELLRRVPPDLAAYYQALPLAREEGRVTVVTAHPGNRAAIQVLARLLGAEVVPVADSETAVDSAIRQLYPAQATACAVLAWTDNPDWRARVHAAAALYADLLGHAPIHLHGDTRAPDVLARLAQSPDALLVTHLDDPDALAALMHQGSANLLLVRGETRLPRRVLVALRGYGSDHAALRQTRPLAGNSRAAVTVLPLADDLTPRADQMRPAHAAGRRHLDDCLRGLGHLPVAVRLRSGSAAEQLLAELAQDSYDLLVIAAEAWGDFVLQTLSHLQIAGALPDQPVLIIRPPLAWPPESAEPGAALPEEAQ